LNKFDGKLLSSRVYPEFFSIEKTDRVLNLGCGDGPQAAIYAGQFGEMVGVDVNVDRLKAGERRLSSMGIGSYTTLEANVESVPLQDAQFDKVIAIDIVEHVENPSQLCAEAHRLLAPGGHLLMTFPAMHDRVVHALSGVKNFVVRNRNNHSHVESGEWNPDAHNQHESVSDWIRMVEDADFTVAAKRATTMFMPLHLYGIPRFWFSNEAIHSIDRQICRVPGLKNYGQTLMVEFVKTTSNS